MVFASLAYLSNKNPMHVGDSNVAGLLANSLTQQNNEKQSF